MFNKYDFSLFSLPNQKRLAQHGILDPIDAKLLSNQHLLAINSALRPQDVMPFLDLIKSMTVNLTQISGKKMLTYEVVSEARVRNALTAKQAQSSSTPPPANSPKKSKKAHEAINKATPLKMTEHSHRRTQPNGCETPLQLHQRAKFTCYVTASGSHTQSIQKPHSNSTHPSLTPNHHKHALREEVAKRFTQNSPQKTIAKLCLFNPTPKKTKEFARISANTQKTKKPTGWEEMEHKRTNGIIPKSK